LEGDAGIAANSENSPSLNPQFTENSTAGFYRDWLPVPDRISASDSGASKEVEQLDSIVSIRPINPHYT
jgi:hypothetical protein